MTHDNCATPVAQLCHACGTTVPCLWHKRAMPVAQTCHTCGTML
ncbi:hypothetical protein [Bacteroides sp. 224]|nr:hypothetical protein [Bacteroides sp. 224]